MLQLTTYLNWINGFFVIFDNGIPEFFITTQIELSIILEKVLSLGAGILTLHDLININKTTYVEEIRNFFLLMEVYGLNTDVVGKLCVSTDRKENVDNL